jgi:hypothetical protein
MSLRSEHHQQIDHVSFNTLSPSSAGTTMVKPRTFIVFVRPQYRNKFWATADGEIEFSEPSALFLAQTLRRQQAEKLYGLPKRGAPLDSRDLSGEELRTLLAAFSR